MSKADIVEFFDRHAGPDPRCPVREALRCEHAPAHLPTHHGNRVLRRIQLMKSDARGSAGHPGLPRSSAVAPAAVPDDQLRRRDRLPGRIGGHRPEDRVVSCSLRYVDWSTGPELPRTLRTEDYSRVRESRMLFAQKVDRTVDAGIVDMLWRYARPTGSMDAEADRPASVLAGMRRMDLLGSAREIFRERPRLPLHDQDVLNLIFRECHDVLPLAFNMFEPVAVASPTWKRVRSDRPVTLRARSPPHVPEGRGKNGRPGSKAVVAPCCRDVDDKAADVQLGLPAPPRAAVVLTALPPLPECQTGETASCRHGGVR